MASTLEIFLRWEVAALTLAVFIGASLRTNERDAGRRTPFVFFFFWKKERLRGSTSNTVNQSTPNTRATP